MKIRIAILAAVAFTGTALTFATPAAAAIDLGMTTANSGATPEPRAVLLHLAEVKPVAGGVVVVRGNNGSTVVRGGLNKGTNSNGVNAPKQKADKDAVNTSRSNKKAGLAAGSSNTGGKQNAPISTSRSNKKHGIVVGAGPGAGPKAAIEQSYSGR